MLPAVGLRLVLVWTIEKLSGPFWRACFTILDGVIALQMPKDTGVAVIADSTIDRRFWSNANSGMDHFEIGGLVAEKWKLESSISQGHVLRDE